MEGEGWYRYRLSHTRTCQRMHTLALTSRDGDLRVHGRPVLPRRRSIIGTMQELVQHVLNTRLDSPCSCSCSSARASLFPACISLRVSHGNCVVQADALSAATDDVEHVCGLRGGGGGVRGGNDIQPGHSDRTYVGRKDIPARMPLMLVSMFSSSFRDLSVIGCPFSSKFSLLM